MNLLLVTIPLILHSIPIECKIKSVHIIMRHSARAPVTPNPTQSHIEDDKRWPNGLLQLTDGGIKQARNVGKYLRETYQSFYPKNSKNAILRSTNVDRCLDTLALVSGELWRPSITGDWIQPRIYSSSMPFDGTIFHSPYCPKADIETSKNLNTPKVMAFNKDYQWLYNYVSNTTGFPATMMGTILAYDIARSAKVAGNEVPKWATDYFYNEMGYIFYKFFDFYFSSEMAIKLKIGLLLKELKTRMDQVWDSSLEIDRWYKNFFIYSTHDFEIFGLNRALGLEQTTYIPFLAMIILELHEINNKKFVKVFYINKTESLPIDGIQKKPSFCPDYNCPYNTFTSSISNLFPDWKTDCGIPNDFDPYPVMERYLTNTDDHDLFKPDNSDDSYLQRLIS